MFRNLLHLIFTFVVVLTAAGLVSAQGADASTRNGNAPKEEYPKNIQESLAKQRIEREKKDFAELLSRGEEAAKISDELDKSFTQNNQLSSNDLKKLDRMEKLVKKIRSEIGGDDDGEKAATDEKPLSVINALKALRSNTVKLVDELKKSTRYSVSVVAVESSNLLLKVVRLLRFGKQEN